MDHSVGGFTPTIILPPGVDCSKRKSSTNSLNTTNKKPKLAPIEFTNAEIISIRKLENILENFWRNEKFTGLQISSMQKVLNKQLENLLDELMDTPKCGVLSTFNLKKLERILRREKLIGPEKNTLVGDLAIALSPTHFRVIMTHAELS